MKDGMKSRVFILAVMAMAAVSFSACGSGSGGSSAPPPSNANEWTWMSGANVVRQWGTYGALGTASPSNVPGAREQAVSWSDASGNFWLFGGNGFDSAGGDGFLNDLWKYSSGQWTWMGGSSTVNQPGVYGTLLQAASGNIPGARNSEVRWTDASGNFWLFGGGYEPADTVYYFNDLWEYSPSTSQWTWMGGSSAMDQPGVYGSPGQAASTNIPGGRFHDVSWKDSSGNFWLFGGNALDASGTLGHLNDLWEYNVSTGEWTWMGGPSLASEAGIGIYGTQGKPSSSNIPGGREQASGWTDASGNFWLFGGNGYDSAGTYGFLNDLWEYSPSAGQWTWVGGPSVVNQPATYGTQGTAASGNIPGARNACANWLDASGNFWLFGGYFHNWTTGQISYLNDLWRYSGGEWTWMGGSTADNQSGVYGTLGTAGSGNIPGSRHYSVTWIDRSGNLWLFGGNAFDSTGTRDYINDLWKYEP